MCFAHHLFFFKEKVIGRDWAFDTFLITDIAYEEYIEKPCF